VGDPDRSFHLVDVLAAFASAPEGVNDEVTLVDVNINIFFQLGTTSILANEVWRRFLHRMEITHQTMYSPLSL